MPVQAWGGIHLLAAVLLILWLLTAHHRVLGQAAHGCSLALTMGWFGAFIVRWLSDESTTIVNCEHWAVLLFLTVWSFMGRNVRRNAELTR
jgi:hypothetical protein